jgi:TonB family protein
MKQMTLQRSLFVSIGIHALIFGTAIAFAGYAAGALRGRHDISISVALVGPDSIPGPARAASQVARQHQPSKPRFSRDTGMPPLEPLRIDASGVRTEQTPVSVDEGRKVNQRPDIKGAESSGQSSGSQFGMVPPGQWALISAALEQAKVYPRLARERGIQGVVRVRFKLKPSGDVDRVEIAKSSGYDVLDAASIKTVYRASPMPYVNGWLELPMAYVLK